MSKSQTTRTRQRKQQDTDTVFGRLMRSKGMEAAQLAERARVSLSTIYRAIQGAVPRSEAVLVAIANALGITEADCRQAIEASGGGY